MSCSLGAKRQMKSMRSLNWSGMTSTTLCTLDLPIQHLKSLIGIHHNNAQFKQHGVQAEQPHLMIERQGGDIRQLVQSRLLIGTGHLLALDVIAYHFMRRINSILNFLPPLIP